MAIDVKEINNEIQVIIWSGFKKIHSYPSIKKIN